VSEHDDRLESRLPTEGVYWTALAKRIDARAAPTLERRRERISRRAIWWTRTELSPALACGAVVCAAAAWWFVPSQAVAADAGIVARALQPAHPLAEQFLGAATAPDLAALVSSGATATPTESE